MGLIGYMGYIGYIGYIGCGVYRVYGIECSINGNRGGYATCVHGGQLDPSVHLFGKLFAYSA